MIKMLKTSVMKGMLLLALFVGATLQLSAQQFTVKGVVKAGGETLVGATVYEKDGQGTATDIDGEFALVVSSPEATILVSFIGYETAEVPVAGQTYLTIELKEDGEMLEEVVAIGYGIQKKKLATGASVQVKGDQLQKENAVNAIKAMQGKTPGVQITQSSGQPGKGMNVIIRGMGSIQGVGPLYLVDGVQTDNLDYLSNADIESINILKDAASAAIYGAQASNGVVLVTTKAGAKGTGQVTFDAYYGVQNLAKKVELLNADQYALIMNEAQMNAGKAPLYLDDKAAFLAKYGDTDWIDEIVVPNAPTYDYSLGFTGGSATSLYSISLGLTGQDGIVGGHDESSYQRYNFRVNTEHKLYGDVLKIGEHITLSYTKTIGVGEGGLYSGSPIRNAFGVTPFLPMYDDEGNFLINTTNASTYKGTSWVPWLDGEANPYASMVYGETGSADLRIIGDVYAELQPISGLKLKTLFGLNIYSGASRAFEPVYKLSSLNYNNNDYATQNMSRNIAWNWDNTISYDFALDSHHATVLVGSSARESQGSWMYTKNADLIIADYEHAWINNATNTSNSTLWSFQGAPNDESMMLSAFGRVSYDFNETYMFNATFRADGSSRFAKGHRWGYFPSVSAGWIMSNESFLSDVEWLDYFRVRASWGQVGNQNIKAWQYLATIATSNTYYYFGKGVAENTLIAPGSTINVTGAFADRLSNVDLKWETSEQADFGFDLRLLKSRLGINFDLYKKSSKDWLIEVPILATTGANAPFVNGGDVVNTGVELDLTWNDTMGDFKYSIGVNGAYNKNVVQNVPTESGYISGTANEIYNNAEAAYRKAEAGFPVGYFWGYTTDGILQNQGEVDEYLASLDGKKGNTLQGNNISAGDVRFVDLNGDKRISEADKTMIGKPTPDFTFGLSLSLSWKGIDFSLNGYGMAGNDVFQSYRNMAATFDNYTTEILKRWHGEGTSHTLPRVTQSNMNYFVSDLFVHDATFFRISNIQLGYDCAKLIGWAPLTQMRLYVALINPFTLTSYTGMDPEVGYGTDASTSGFDLGFYPRSKTTMVGLNVKF